MRGLVFGGLCSGSFVVCVSKPWSRVQNQGLHASQQAIQLGMRFCELLSESSILASCLGQSFALIYVVVIRSFAKIADQIGSAASKCLL